MLKLLVFYNLIVVTLISWMGWRSIDSIAGAIFPLLLLPLGYQLGLDLVKRPRRLSPISRPVTLEKSLTGQVIAESAAVSDRDRRLFLKLVGSTGLSLFFMSVIGKKSAQAAFFGSMPGPGTVALKDSTGNQIDPAEKQPTDGYKISQLDDAGATYLYFGFVNKDGAWYIQRETVSGVNAGDYRYFKGSTNFSGNWGNRTDLAYDDFEDIF